MEKRLQFAFLISVFSLIFIASASFPARDSLGISPQDESYYKTSVIKCKDGSKKFTKGQLNDEFCDCPDGTDEPGTSACPEGKFYCRNIGHSPLKIYSSRVNDGICDCCDGSDEYDGKVNCTNTCWEAGKAAREKLKKKIATFKDGAIIRNKEVENAKVAFAKDEAELAKLKGEEKMLKNLVDKLKEQKERIEKAEAEEKEQKEAEEKRLKEEAEKVAAKEAESVEKKEEVLEPSDEEGENGDKNEEQDGNDVDDKNNDLSNKMSPSEKYAKYDQEMDETHNEPIKSENEKEEITTEQHLSDDSSAKDPNAPPEGLSKEELGRLVASRWTGENSKSTENVENTPQNDKNTPPNDESTPQNDENTPEKEDDFFKDHDETEDASEEEEGYHSEMEDDRHKYKNEDSDENKYDDDHEYESDEEYENDNNNHKFDDADKNDNSDTGSASWLWLEKIQQTVQTVFQSFNFFKTPVDLSEASRVKKEYDDLSSKLSKIQSRISNLNDKLKHDFGKDKEFYSFYDHCFENKQNKYVYKVCPYKKASQNEGHSSTQLGRWENFEDSYRVMVFSNGDHCWNGPNRSLKVRLRCGLKNEVADVDEPSRCEYVAILSTPAVCVEEKLKELEQKLEDLNSKQPSIHDEL